MAQKEEEDFSSAAEEQQRAMPEPESGWERAQEWASLVGCVSGAFGIIESVKLENFMYHSVLGPVKLGPNINFVVDGRGQNVLLSAIVVCLGGKSLGLCWRDFVKEGESSARVSITLRNRGDCAFKPDKYGDSITVQQCITLDVDAFYILKDRAGNMVSSEREEFTDMLNHFHIWVDNPAAILHQGIGRQLLQTTDDSDRYKLFLKSTKLEERREEYLEILKEKVRNRQEIDQCEEEVDRLKYQSRMTENRFQNMADLNGKLEVLRHEMAWTVVNETERDLDDMASSISAGDQLTVTFRQQLVVSKAKMVEAEKKQRTISENIRKLNEDAAALELKCAEAKDTSEKSDGAYVQAKVFRDFSLNEMNRLESVAEQLQKQIEDLKKSQKRAELEKESKMPALVEKLKNFRAQEESLFQNIQHIHRIVEKDDEEHYRLKQEESSIQQMLHEEEIHLDQLKECKSEPLKRFGPQIPALVTAIEDTYMQGDFTYKPLGPLAACIRLRDPEFALAVERCLRGLLLAFFCDNQKDEQVLQELMKTFYPSGSSRPQIIVSAFECELYDVTERAAYHPEFPTVLAALEISNAVVANTLVDMRGIEAVLLVKNNSLAHTVMHGQGPPKNCRSILTASGDEVYEGCYSSCEKSRPTYLGDVEIEISNLEKEIENKKAQLAVYQGHLCTLERETKKNRDTIENRYQCLKETRVQATNITSEMKDLEKENRNWSTDLLALEKQAQKAEEKIKQVEKKLKTQEEEVEKLQQLRIADEKRHQEVKLKCNQVSNIVQFLRREQNQAALEVNTQSQSVLHCESALKEHLNSLQAKKEKAAIKQRELESKVALAKCICPERINVTRASSVLDHEIDMLKQTIQSENYTYGSQEEIRKQIEQLKERCVALNDKLKDLKMVLMTLEEKSAQEYVMYKKRARSLSLQCKLYFQRLLSQWSIFGDIHLDHDNETLSVSVQPAEESGASFSDTDVFSGDTQCFSNLLFILSLWAVTQSPFRCLDSFHVCMNSDQAKIATDMIINIAHCQQRSQFILIIPDHLSFLPPSPLIKILEIPDPEICEEAPILLSISSEEEED